MTSEQVRSWFKKNLDRKMREFGVPHWRISVSYMRHESKDDGFHPFMVCQKRFEYEKAVLEIDADICARELDSADELEKMVEHELLHVVSSPFDLYMTMTWEMVTDEHLRGVLNESWRQAQELSVRNMERLVHSLRKEKRK